MQMNQRNPFSKTSQVNSGLGIEIGQQFEQH
jgi:hypothetical protein